MLLREVKSNKTKFNWPFVHRHSSNARKDIKSNWQKAKCDQFPIGFICNEKFCFSHRKLDIPFSLGQSSSWIYLYVNLSISFGCLLDVVGFSFSSVIKIKDFSIVKAKPRPIFLLYEYIRRTSSHQMVLQDRKRMGGKSPNFLFHFTCHIIILQHCVCCSCCCCCCYFGGEFKKKRIAKTFLLSFQWLFSQWTNEFFECEKLFRNGFSVDQKKRRYCHKTRAHKHNLWRHFN